MSDGPQRHSTIAPPPDRDRKTDPPLPTDKPPAEFVTLSENVLLRLSDIETALTQMKAGLSKLDDLHELLMGLAVGPDGQRKGGIVDALSVMNARLAVITANSDMLVKRHAQYADEVTRVHQENVRIRFDLDDHDTRIGRIEAGLPVVNGNGHSG